MRARLVLATASVALLALVVGVAPFQPVAAQAVGEDDASVPVPTYAQQRNLSCEYASLVIAMAAFGSWVSEWTFDQLVPPSENPHWGFRGDINGQWGNTTDYGVYPEALVGPLAQLGFRGEVFYGQGETSRLMAALDAGQPVVVWLGLWGDQSFYEYAADGTPYKLTTGYHVVVAYGYDDTGIHIADPATGGTKWWTWDEFMWKWNVLDGMAMAVAPL